MALLYQRRQAWEVDREALLGQIVAAAPFEPTPDLAFMHAFARPVAPDRAIWDRAVESAGGLDALHRLLAEAAAKPGSRDAYSPHMQSGTYWHREGADAWRLSSQPEVRPEPGFAQYVADVTMNVDGRGQAFCGRAAERSTPAGQASEGGLVLYEIIVAGNFAGFLSAMGALYRAGSYLGHVDVGLAVTGLEGAYSATLTQRGMIHRLPFNAPTYTRTERVTAAELDDPETVARRMLRHLFEATAGGNFDPFE